MRGLRVDRAREHSGSANILGSNGTHVREVSTYGADCKGVALVMSRQVPVRDF